MAQVVPSNGFISSPDIERLPINIDQMQQMQMAAQQIQSQNMVSPNMIQGLQLPNIGQQGQGQFNNQQLPLIAQQMNMNTMSQQQQPQVNTVIIVNAQSQGLIPDTFNLEHQIEIVKKCCVANFESTFNVPGLGEIKWVENKSCQSCECQCCEFQCCSCCACLKCCDCLKLRFKPYDKIKYETLPAHLVISYSNISSIYFSGALIGYAEVCHPSMRDMFEGRICESYPQVRIRGSQQHGPKFVILPKPSCIPKNRFNVSPLSFFTACFCGLMYTSREIYVYKQYGTQKEGTRVATFKNTRSCRQAWYDTCQFQFGCDFRNWPHYGITFTHEVSQEERILIVAGLIHFSMVDQYNF